jgi:uncharacterized protein YcfL
MRVGPGKDRSSIVPVQAGRRHHKQLTSLAEEWLNIGVAAKSQDIPATRMTTTQRTYPGLLALCALALLAGCASAPSRDEPQETTKFTVENTDRYIALDAATEAAVSCTGLQELLLGDGRLEVVANLRNSGTGDAKVQVQCVFLDDRGMPIGAAAPWQSLTISNSATEVVRFTAPTAEAKKYSIRVRKAR